MRPAGVAQAPAANRNMRSGLARWSHPAAAYRRHDPSSSPSCRNRVPTLQEDRRFEALCVAKRKERGLPDIDIKGACRVK